MIHSLPWFVFHSKVFGMCVCVCGGGGGCATTSFYYAKLCMHICQDLQVLQAFWYSIPPIRRKAKVILRAEKGAATETYIVDDNREQSLLGEQDTILLGIVKLSP